VSSSAASRVRRNVAGVVVLVGVVFVGWLAPVGVRAGTYDVVACDAAGGPNNSWIPTVINAAGATAYTACPTGGDPWRGIITRNVVVAGGGTSTATAQMKFTAAPGTTIIGLAAAYDFYRADAKWESVLSTGTQALRGCAVGGPNVCGLTSQGVAQWVDVPGGSQVIYIDVSCVSNGCPLAGDAAHNYLSAYARLASASVRLQDDSPPAINGVSGGLWADGWRSGNQPVAVDASDNSGIRRTAVLVDGQQRLKLDRACDASQVVPCPNGVDTYEGLPTGAYTDGPHDVTVQAVDAAGNVSSASRSVLVDNSPPGPPQAVTVEGGEGWQPRTAFNLHWANPPASGAPTVGVNWQICQAGNPPTSCVSGSKDGDKLETLNALPVPKEGDWVLKLWLRDAAGNNTSNNGVSVHLRSDTQAPTAVFSPIDPADPTRVVVQAADATSGIGSGSIDFKPHDADAWTSVPAKVDGGRLIVNLPDETMADGVYDLRGHAVDRAGNEKSTTTLSDGTSMSVTLPLRSPTHITGGRLQTRKRKGKRVRYLGTRLRLRYAHRTRLSGRLADKDNKSMASTPLAVSELVDVPGASWQPVRTLSTSASGSYNFRTAKRGTSRTIRIRYEGTPTVRPSQADVHVAVAASSTIHVSRRTVRRRHAVRFSGNLRGGHVLPGKLVQLQVLNGGRWQTFANPRAKRDGSWTSVYKFRGGPHRWPFRARIPSQPGYPFATGTTERISVHVRAR
jgi:hypothetical protein